MIAIRIYHWYKRSCESAIKIHKKYKWNENISRQKKNDLSLASPTIILWLTSISKAKKNEHIIQNLLEFPVFPSSKVR